MCTTLTLESDAYDTALAYARARPLKLGRAVSELIHLSRADRLSIRQRDDVWVLELLPDTPAVTAARVKELLEEAP